MKRSLTLILCLFMLLLTVAGCTTPATTTNPTTNDTGTTTAESTTLGPPAEIVYVYPLFSEQVDQTLISDTISDLSLAKINVKVKCEGIAIANYATQVPLKITGNEAMDIVLTMPGGPTLYATMVNQNQLKDITDLAPMYCQGVIDAFNAVNPGYLAGANIGGRMYGFPNLFDKVSNTIMDMRKDVLVASNTLDAYKSAKNITDLEAVVKVLAENNDMPVMISGGSAGGIVIASMSRATNFDDFSTSLVSEFFSSAEWAYGAIFGDDNTTVVNGYASEYFNQLTTIAHDWFLKGYISKDAATQTENNYTILKANGGMSNVTDGELGHQAFASSQAGMDIVTITLAPAIVNTGIMQKFVVGVPVTCKEDEAALKFIDLLYTDADVVNLLNFGIEDTHYVSNADGTISMPAGIDSKSARYWVNSSFLFGSQYLAKVVAPDAPDLRQQALALNKAAKTSPLLGFAVNPTAFTNEYTAVVNAVAQFRPGLCAGSSDPATELPKFLAALEDAGLSKIIKEVQAQVDAFMANKK